MEFFCCRSAKLEKKRREEKGDWKLRGAGEERNIKEGEKPTGKL